MSREVLQQALEALEGSISLTMDKIAQRHEAVTAIKAALVTKDVSLPEQEPMVTKGEKGLMLHVGWDDLPAGTKLYTAPPQREWVGLTVEDHNNLWRAGLSHQDIDLVEAKLKEKNA